MFYDGYLLTSDLALAIIFIIFGLFTVVGNIFVCLVYIKDPLKNLRTVSNFFVVNLAVADILVGITVEPLNASSFWVKENRAVLFSFYVLAILSCVCSILNIAALMVDRYLAVSKPFKYRSIVTSQRVRWTLVLIWFYSIHFSLLPVFGWRTKGFQIYLYTLGVLLPTAIMLVCYYGLLRILRAKTKTLKNSSDHKESAYMKRIIARERRISTTVLIMLLVFLFAWCPFVIVDFILVFRPDCRTGKSLRLARDTTLTLGFFSSGVNPVLYAWRVPNFNRGLHRIFPLTSIRKENKTKVRRIKVSPAKESKHQTRRSDSSVRSTKVSPASSVIASVIGDDSISNFAYIDQNIRNKLETEGNTGTQREHIAKVYDVDVFAP